MKRFQDKKQIKSRFYSGWTIAGLVILVLILGNGVLKLYFRERESASMRSEAEAKLNLLNERKQTLAAQIDKLDTPEGVEQEIRQKFNVTKPGENVVLIVDASTTATTTAQTGFWGSLWSKIWN